MALITPTGEYENSADEPKSDEGGSSSFQTPQFRHTSIPRTVSPASSMRHTTSSSPSSGNDNDNDNLPAIPKDIPWSEVEKYFKKR